MRSVERNKTGNSTLNSFASNCYQIIMLVAEGSKKETVRQTDLDDSSSSTSTRIGPTSKMLLGRRSSVQESAFTKLVVLGNLRRLWQRGSTERIISRDSVVRACPLEEYLREWKAIESPKTGLYSQRPTLLCAICKYWKKTWKRLECSLKTSRVKDGYLHVEPRFPLI